ncbi:4-hydroxy-2-oxovalerate aldolase [Limnochorda pilosa]|uniref:4-hydroxy-2-oxovalerate aldolase n=1 Tax=Limnochorda pilosa TaxID=1555112 RepID=A0A0K2SMF6_LIMPI|nr:4-hydroxy-2-oxovalerate aldolase [Limnochorda pilosa]
MVLADVTLRDGSHTVNHSFTTEQVRRVVAGLDRAGVPIVEVCHGDGLGGSSYQYGFSAVPELELIEAAAQTARRAKISVLLLPGIGVRDDLRQAAALGATVARIATHVTEADIAEQHIGLAKELGMTAVGFLMMAHTGSPEVVARQGRIMERAGADVVYVVDSAGAMTMEDVHARVSALREALACDVGFHAHNNLGLGVGNTITAARAGATWLDGSMCGFGAGAGNAQTEALVAVLQKLGYECGVDLLPLLDAADAVVRPLLPRPQVLDSKSLILGFAGVYSSFLLHAERAAERFDVDPREVLVEAGRLKSVGGQEDILVEIALGLSTRGAGQAEAVTR